MQSYFCFHKNAAFASFNTESSLPSLKYSRFCPILPQSSLGLEVKKIIQHLSETAVARAFSAQLTTITDFSVYKEKYKYLELLCLEGTRGKKWLF